MILEILTIYSLIFSGILQGIIWFSDSPEVIASNYKFQQFQQVLDSSWSKDLMVGELHGPTTDSLTALLRVIQPEAVEPSIPATQHQIITDYLLKMLNPAVESTWQSKPMGEIRKLYTMTQIALATHCANLFQGDAVGYQYWTFPSVKELHALQTKPGFFNATRQMLLSFPNYPCGAPDTLPEFKDYYGGATNRKLQWRLEAVQHLKN